MNNWIKSSGIVMIAALIGAPSFAQTTQKDSKKEEQEIIIRKKDGKEGKTTIVIDGDNVTINGKPMDEFKGENITVLRRRGPIGSAPGRVNMLPRGGFQMFDRGNMPGSNKALLGVVTEKADDGVKVVNVNEESGAAKAGLKSDDVITRVGDKKIEDPSDLVEAIGKYKPNDKVDITYKRAGKENKTTVTLGENKMRNFSFNLGDGQIFNMPTPPNAPDAPMVFFNRKPKLGLQIEDLEQGKGVKVKDVDEDSPASKAGLKEGDVITEVNGKDVAGVDEIRTAIRDVKEGDSVRLKYKRGNSTQTAEVKIPKRLKSADL